MHVFITHYWYPGTGVGSPIATSLSSNNFSDHIEREKKTGRPHLVTLRVCLQKRMQWWAFVCRMHILQKNSSEVFGLSVFGTEDSELVSSEV